MLPKRLLQEKTNCNPTPPSKSCLLSAPSVKDFGRFWWQIDPQDANPFVHVSNCVTLQLLHILCDL